MTNVGAGPVAVVGQGLDEERDPAGAITLIHDILDLVSVDALAGSHGDRPLDVVFGHGGVPCLLDRQGEGGIALDVASALPGGDRDGSRQLREVLAATLVDDRLLVLDRSPFGMS